MFKCSRKFNPTLLHWATGVSSKGLGFFFNVPLIFQGILLYIVKHVRFEYLTRTASVSLVRALCYLYLNSYSPSVRQSVSLSVIGICNPFLNPPQVLGLFEFKHNWYTTETSKTLKSTLLYASVREAAKKNPPLMTRLLRPYPPPSSLMAIGTFLKIFLVLKKPKTWQLFFSQQFLD